MPSIRAEMRVSQKLSPEIVGPSLKTATEILHRAYSKRTRETQKVTDVSDVRCHFKASLSGLLPVSCVGEGAFCFLVG